MKKVFRILMLVALPSSAAAMQAEDQLYLVKGPGVGDVTCYYQHGQFGIIHDDMVSQIPSEDVDKVLHNLDSIKLLNFLGNGGYLYVSQLNNGDYRLQAKVRGIGGGMIMSTPKKKPAVPKKDFNTAFIVTTGVFLIVSGVICGPAMVPLLMAGGSAGAVAEGAGILVFNAVVGGYGVTSALTHGAEEPVAQVVVVPLEEFEQIRTFSHKSIEEMREVLATQAFVELPDQVKIPCLRIWSELNQRNWDQLQRELKIKEYQEEHPEEGNFLRGGGQAWGPPASSESPALEEIIFDEAEDKGKSDVTFLEIEGFDSDIDSDELDYRMLHLRTQNQKGNYINSSDHD